MARRSLGGKSAGKTNDAVTSPDDVIEPLGYALSVMHDEAQPTTLRATMARAALPFLHSRRVPMLPMPTEDRRPEFGLRASHRASLHAPTPESSFTPGRWKEKLHAAEARTQASEADAQHHAALARAAEQRAQTAEALVRELEKKTLAATTRAREMEERAQAMEERALAADARIARLEKGKARAVKPTQESASRVLDDEAREQLAMAQHRARMAEMRAVDMEQRALAAEAIIAGSR
jgi:hypothetical protein